MRILVRGQELKAVRAAQEALTSAGFEAAALPGAPEARRLHDQGNDILIVPSLALDDPKAAAFAEAARASRPAPLAVLIGLPLAAPPPAVTTPLFGYDGALALDAPAKQVEAQLKALIRAAITREENVRRRQTALALGALAFVQQETRALKALYIGAPSALFLHLENAITQQGGALSAAFTSYAGFDHLHDDVFDAVILNAAADPSTALSLCGALRRNARLHHVPTLMVTQPGDAATAQSALERGAAAIVEAHDDPRASLGWLFEAVRTERRRLADEHELNALRDAMGDPRTGLMRRAPFEAHIDRLARDHHESGRPLALVALRVRPALGARAPSDADWRKGFAEIASLAGRLVRVSDCAAALPGDRIVIALPASPLASAKRVAERITSVAECTAFASGQDGAGPLAFERSVVELQAGESGAGLLSRATAPLNQHWATA